MRLLLYLQEDRTLSQLLRDAKAASHQACKCNLMLDYICLELYLDINQRLTYQARKLAEIKFLMVVTNWKTSNMQPGQLIVKL